MVSTPITVDQPPFVLIHPLISLDDGTNVVEFECGANQVVAEPSQDENTTETFCGTYTTYKPEVWTVTITALTSFGDAGVWNNLRPLVGKVCDLLIVPDSANPVSVDNVALSARALVKAFKYLDAAVGETSEFDLDLAIQGIPDFLETPPVATVAASTSSSAGASTPAT